MSSPDEIEFLMEEIQAGKRFARLKQFKGINSSQILECQFNFEPRLRFVRYISSFNRLLCDYTNFNFRVCGLRKGCIEAEFFAKNFTEVEKNLVRRQIGILISETELAEEYQIRHLSIFGSHRVELHVKS